MKRGLLCSCEYGRGSVAFPGIAGYCRIMMAYGESGNRSSQRVVAAGPAEGPRLLGLSLATVRSVANGVSAWLSSSFLQGQFSCGRITCGQRAGHYRHARGIVQ
ncbi:MAG: hypothetical protein R2864_11465 [Syntrophotaleaceae bacterium]